MSARDAVDLGDLQRWFRAVVMHPVGVAAGLASPEAKQHLPVGLGDLETIICPSIDQSAVDRLAVYHRSYTLRLLECMRAKYPALRHALGTSLFDDFALDFLREHPPRSYTLQSLDRQFPEHLAATRPDDVVANDGCEPWPEFIVDLARLERLVSEVFDGRGLERPGSEWQPPVLAPETDERRVCIQAAPSLRVLRSAYPVGRYLLAVHRGEDPDLPRPEPTFLALGRRDYVVQLHELTEAACLVLESLVDGETLESSVHRAGKQVTGEAWDWFRGWAKAGLFTSVSIAENAGRKQWEVP